MKFLEFITEAAKSVQNNQKKPTTSSKGRQTAANNQEDKHVAITFGPVSYTHLTLPTIYSV